MADVRNWLETLNLSQYAEAFEANDIDWELLPQLDHEVLKDIGVHSAGARLRILKAVENLSPQTDAPSVSEAAAAPGTSRAAPIGEAEHRQLTVMFCDLVGSTALAEDLDLEEYRDVLAQYHAVSGNAIERYEGYIARYMGDGLLVYFGYPQAHENDAERAIRAGLDIVDAVSALTFRQDLRLQVRIGIATGHVVVGDIVGEGASEERAALGDAPNLSARLQALAEPNTIFISNATRDLTGKLFAHEDAGRHRLKGFTGEVQVWRVISEASTQSRFEATRSPSGADMVGRETEVLLLLDRWMRARVDEGQVVLLWGEPGIGKSRLAHALRERIGAQPHNLVQLQCAAHHINSAFYPFIECIRRVAGIAQRDPAASQIEKLEAWVTADGESVGEVVPVLASLLSISTQGSYPVPDLTPQQQKQKTIEVLARQFTSPASDAPLLLLFEDAQWADPSTLEVMTALIDSVPTTAMLVIITHRPEFTPPWQGRGHVTSHSLGRLGKRDVIELVENITDGSLPAPLLGEIVARTDGVPLFVEELTKTVLEANEGAGAEPRDAQRLLSVPSTLQDLLVARLDRLGNVKELAQIASVIGRDFRYALLAELWSAGTASLEAALTQLEQAELILCRGEPPEASYTFKHALVQDAAYRSLLRSNRERLHARLSEVLEARFPEMVSQVPELLAHHCTAAGRSTEAIRYWKQAADLALGRSAYPERLAHLDSALRVAKGLSDEAERRAWELELQIARGGALMVTQGYRARETGEAFERARSLAGESGDARASFAALRGLHGFYYSRAQLDAALEVAEACLQISEAGSDRNHLSLAHRLVGQTLFIRGELAAARRHLEQALEARSDASSTRVAALTGGGHHLMVPMFLAQVLWMQGYPDQARKLATDAVDEAEASYGAFATTTNMYFFCLILGWRREYQALRESAGRIRQLAGEHDIIEWVSEGGLIADWPHLATGEDAEVTTLAKQRLEAVRNLGGVMTPFKLGVLAQALAVDDPEEALDVIDEALELTKQGERWSEPELMRIKGNILVQSDVAAAEAILQESTRVAREQGARSWELRSATDLARLWGAQGKSEAAHELLWAICDQFTEGLDTPDMQDAKALLATLATA